MLVAGFENAKELSANASEIIGSIGRAYIRLYNSNYATVEQCKELEKVYSGSKGKEMLLSLVEKHKGNSPNQKMYAILKKAGIENERLKLLIKASGQSYAG